MMGFFDLFKRAPSITAGEVRNYIHQRQPDEYCLLDVRQPSEYEQGHLPGAKLIPLSHLQRQIGELDPGKTIIVYCRTGNRSNAAASQLLAAGYKGTFNMSGGIVSYNGVIASGPPESGMFCFPESLAPRELIAVAWFLENGTLAFLKSTSAGLSSGKSVIEAVIKDKADHKEKLRQLYKDLTGQVPADNFPAGVTDLPSEQVMVGCVKVSDAVRWAGGKADREILEMLISLSANACDLYLKLGRIMKSEDARRLFAILAKEEQVAIEKISVAFERTL